MATVLAFVIGGLYAAAMYMLLRRNLLKLAIGMGLLSNGANLLIFSAASLTRARLPIVPEGESVLRPEAADPLPQALILTAIVINFGLQAFTLVLIQRAYQTLETDDVYDLRATEE